jgi:hypothetical protein
MFFTSTSFAQDIDEQLLLVETQKILTYLDLYDEIYSRGGEDYVIATNISNSAARSINVVMNAYHLIHIYNFISGKEDKSKVGNYLRIQLPHASRLLKIELNLTEGIISSATNKEIKDTTELYKSSLDLVIKILNLFT